MPLKNQNTSYNKYFIEKVVSKTREILTYILISCHNQQDFERLTKAKI